MLKAYTDESQETHQWLSWTSLKCQYENSARNINRFRRNRGYNNEAEKEIAGAISSDLNRTIQELEKRCLYEFNTLSEDEIKNAKLTEKQRQIAYLRQEHSISEVAKILNIEVCTAFLIYKEALRKIEKYLKLEEDKKKLNVLSEQQKLICCMKNEGKTDREIAVILEISLNSLKTQKRRIRNKLGVTKS